MFKRLIAGFMSLVIAAGCLCIPAGADALPDIKYDSRIAQLTGLLKQDEKTVKAVSKLGKAAVFISVSDGKQQAKTVYSCSRDLDTAVEKALEKAKSTQVYPKWMKLDVVTSVTKTAYSEFKTKYAGKPGLMRLGVSFNDYFGRALLEAQINSSGLMDHETGELDLERINTYFKSTKKKQLEKIPDTLYLFKTQGYFSDGRAYKLTSGKQNAAGRREYTLDKEGLVALAERSSAYFSSICDKDGKFVYGYYPIDNKEIDGYNIIRHGGAVWDLILQYDMTKDEKLVPVIERSLGYLYNNLWFYDEKTAFLAQDDVLNIGGTGVSLLAFTSYAEILGSDKYNNVIEALANGVLLMQKEDGSFTHTVKKDDFSIYKDYVIIYYDGEALFGLLKAYGIIKDASFLAGAEKAADYFIKNGYEKEHSHWISYAFNELTKYSPKTEYYTFGLKNIPTEYLEAMKRTASGSPTRGETLGAATDMYLRLIKSGARCPALADFDEKLLVSAFDYRADYGLNYFMFPEYAMYFKDPKTVLYSFAVREDLFRIRIDDIQHFMGGYYLYWKNLDDIAAYR